MADDEARWREAWVGAEFEGQVELLEAENKLTIKCEEVAAEYGEDAEVLDDGRTACLADGDYVAFGVVERPGAAPMAVNIYHIPLRRKRKAQMAAAAAVVAVKKKKKAEEPAVPPALRDELAGVVRFQNEHGHMFIECRKVWEVYHKDVKLLSSEVPEGLEIGDPVQFYVRPPDWEGGAPLAFNLSKAEGAVAEAIRSSSYFLRKGGRKGKGAGKAANTRPLMRMVGTVKKKSMNTGRHFVACQDISDVYGKDAQIPPNEVIPDLAAGDQIEFEVEEPGEGSSACPLARNIKKITKSARRAAPAADDGEEDVDEAELALGDSTAEAGVEEEDDDVPEDPEVDDDARAELEDAEWLEAEAGDEDGSTWANGKKGAGVVGSQATAKNEPQTKEEWMRRQKEFFSHLPALPKGWIRVRAKSHGKIYYYNVNTGESTPHAPKGTGKPRKEASATNWSDWTTDSGW